MKQGKTVPPEILEVGFDFNWDNKKLWALDLPIEEMSVYELVWHFDLPFWRDGDHWFVVRPKDVLENTDRYPEHQKRIKESDISYPMDIMWHKGRWVFLDGLHRLAQAVQLGLTTVKVRKIPPEKVSDILA